MPLDGAPRTAGHEVRIAGRSKFTETVTLTGFAAVAVGTDDDSAWMAVGTDGDPAWMATWHVV